MKQEEVEEEVEEEEEEEEEDACILECRHPLGIKPEGNVYDEKENVRERGLGHLAVLTDAILLDHVLPLLGEKQLLNLAMVSKAFYVFANHEDLWKNLVFKKLGDNFLFRNGNWKDTCLQRAASEDDRNNNNDDDDDDNDMKDDLITVEAVHTVGYRRLQIPDFYSNHLYQSWLCGNVMLSSKWINTPVSSKPIPRISALKMSVEEFNDKYQRLNMPCIITDAMTADSFNARFKWTDEYLLSKCGENVLFECGQVSMNFSNFHNYMTTNHDERPLYIFDKRFCEVSGFMGDDYKVPEYFKEDLFELLGDSRPDYRWLIVGQKKSGSFFHIDPNSTNAWNAVIRGKKKWIMFPPGVTPPGVFPSEDGGDVIVPVSITEWMMNYYDEASSSDAAIKPLQGICNEGEIMFVPHGWWHFVLNLETTYAITQNFVNRFNLSSVLRFLRNKGDQVSGYGSTSCACDSTCDSSASSSASPNAATGKELYDKFISALESARGLHKPQEIIKILDKEKETANKNLNKNKNKRDIFSLSNNNSNRDKDDNDGNKKGKLEVAESDEGGNHFQFNFNLLDTFNK